MEFRVARILSPVKRQGADRHVRLTLVAFAISVVVTRLFLSLTGYPQVGGGNLHIAHLLWGGLLLFIASLLPQVVANRWVYSTGAVLSGVGVGLFIDEVGKFITRNNDYFYPAAAPIIYAVFLLTVMLYLRVRRPPPADPRAELYRIFEDFSEVLDHDLDPQEQADLEARLGVVAGQTTDPDDARLADVLLNYLRSEPAVRHQPIPGPLAQFLARLRWVEERVLTRPRFRGLVIIGLVALGLLSIGQLAVLVLAAGVGPAGLSQEARAVAGLPTAPVASPVLARPTAGALPGMGFRGDALLAPGTDADNAVQSVVTPSAAQVNAAAATANPDVATVALPNRPIRPDARTFRGRVAFWLRAGLEALIGLVLLIAAFFFIIRRDHTGVILGALALLVALTTLNLLVFYFDQMAAVVDAIVEFGLYRLIIHYRQRYLALVPL